MIIDTKFLGEIDIKDEGIINFDEGILGFEGINKYIILDLYDDGIFKCLQSVEHKELAFIIINPWDVFQDYEIDIDDTELLTLGSADIKDYVICTLVTAAENMITTNLIGPVIINMVSHRGKQIVLTKSSYTTRHNILNLIKKKE